LSGTILSRLGSRTAPCAVMRSVCAVMRSGADSSVRRRVPRGLARPGDLTARPDTRAAAAQARTLAPAIIFIDEIDAVGRVRGGAMGNDERDQTLNQARARLAGAETRGGFGPSNLGCGLHQAKGGRLGPGAARLAPRLPGTRSRSGSRQALQLRRSPASRVTERAEAEAGGDTPVASAQPRGSPSRGSRAAGAAVASGALVASAARRRAGRARSRHARAAAGRRVHRMRARVGSGLIPTLC